MFAIILQALVPVVFGIALGWLIGFLNILDSERVRAISTYIVSVALPAALFVGVFNFAPAQLENGRYVAILAISLLVPWAIGFALVRLGFRSSTQSAGMVALNAGFPDLAYFGLPVLTAVIGVQGLLPVIVGNIIISVIVVPLSMVLLGAGTAGGESLGAVLRNLKATVAHPLVWAPVLGAVLVLVGVKLPDLAVSSIRLIGETAGGTALFALGVMLSGLSFKIDKTVISVVLLKNFLQPVLGLVLALALGISGALAEGIVLAMACPCATASAMLSATYRIDEKETTATVVASNAAGIITMAFWIYVVETLWGGGVAG